MRLADRLDAALLRRNLKPEVIERASRELGDELFKEPELLPDEPVKKKKDDKPKIFATLKEGLIAAESMVQDEDGIIVLHVTSVDLPKMSFPQTTGKYIIQDVQRCLSGFEVHLSRQWQ